jgi:glucose-1-phosphate cytidylyltransferase
MREASERVPKPMVPIGSRPILWHVMKYYAHHGHTEFILCLGYKGEVIKEYFLNYDETLSNDFVLHGDGRPVDLMSRDIHDWRISFVDTGLHTSIGGRLRAARPYLGDDEYFLANYGDVLTSEPIDYTAPGHYARDRVASFLCVRPAYTFHVVSVGPDQLVRDIHDITKADIWINGGYFQFHREIFDYMQEGEDLVEEPFRRLVAEDQLVARRFEGFWASMDNVKEKQRLESLLESGHVPWRVWEDPRLETVRAEHLA